AGRRHGRRDRAGRRGPPRGPPRPRSGHPPPNSKENPMNTPIQEPAVVLVHGAFAESASWDGVIARLQELGVEAVAVANPLRSVAGDAAYVRDVVAGLRRPVLLVGPSDGGTAIPAARAGAPPALALGQRSAWAP